MKLLNLTEHGLYIPGWNEPILPYGKVAGMSMERTLVKLMISDSGNGSVKIYQLVPGNVSGLPAAAENTGLIVSTMVRLAVPGRTDLFSPGDLIRDPGGIVCGARSLDGNW